jgi:hypothetical protein
VEKLGKICDFPAKIIPYFSEIKKIGENSNTEEK